MAYCNKTVTVLLLFCFPMHVVQIKAIGLVMNDFFQRRLSNLGAEYTEYRRPLNEGKAELIDWSWTWRYADCGLHSGCSRPFKYILHGETSALVKWWNEGTYSTYEHYSNPVSIWALHSIATFVGERYFRALYWYLKLFPSVTARFTTWWEMRSFEISAPTDLKELVKFTVCSFNIIAEG